MAKLTVIRQNLYADSVTLMRISAQVSALPGIQNVLVGMATELNKELLENLGATTEESAAAGPNDLLVGVVADTEEAVEAALEAVNAQFAQRKRASAAQSETVYSGIREIAALEENYNLAVVSIPGAYAARECRLALERGIHVFLFSDNVTVDEEIALKTLAHEKELLMMGPDCGTAIIGGVPLGFANVVDRGGIGIVAASGTGLQHVTTLIDNMGGGITQAVGVGGRDLSLAVGGRTMLDAMDAVGGDPDTKVLVLLSKPPAEEIADKVLKKAAEIGKPVVICLFGAGKRDLPEGITQCFNIEETAKKAVELATGQPAEVKDSLFDPAKAEAFRAAQLPEQKYVRGIFGGGTLCDETMITFRRLGVPFKSNIPISEDERLADVHVSEGNTFIDMGDDYFTKGKPHPMIDPSLRNIRVVNDALLPDTAVMLLDVELGYGSHPDPAGVLCEAIYEAREKLGGRKVLWIAALIGTKNDPQGFSQQAEKLLKAGCIVTESNVRAARLAADFAARKEVGV